MVAQRSTCLRRKVGAVLVKDRHIIATGYNGAPAGLPHCIDTKRCLRETLRVPSGERHEICLSGNTVIKLLDGTYKTIKELAQSGNDIWVYSVDTATGKIVPALATNPRMTGCRDDLVRVTLDNGKYFTCTKDHKVLLRNCHYCEAGQLKPGSSLMPMHYNFSANNGYESISNTIKARKEKWQNDWIGETYSIPTHILVYRFINDCDIELGNDFLIHHKDEKFKNNTPDNLILLTRGEHASIHHKNNPKDKDFYVNIGHLGHIKQIEELKNNPQFLHCKQMIGKQNMTANWNDPEFIKKMQKLNKQKGRELSQKTNSNPEIIKRRKIGRILKGISYLMFRSQEEVNHQNYELIKKKYKISSKLGDTGPQTPNTETILKYFPSLQEAIEVAKTYNHKVMKVEHLTCKMPVYDLTVPLFENFAIDLGDNSCVFVHNCHAVHAEQNTIIQAAIHGRDTRGSEIYLTCTPCSICAKILVNAGVRRVVYRDGYNDKMAMQILDFGGVTVENYSPGQDGGR